MGSKTEKGKSLLQQIFSETNPWLGRSIFAFAFFVFFAANTAQICWVFLPMFKEGVMTHFNAFWLLIHEVVFVLTIWSYLSAMLSDPGYVPRDLVSPAANIDMLKLETYAVNCEKC